MNIEFHHKTVIVTGAAHGFGRQISLEYARRGASVWACDVLADELAETRALCLEAGGACEIGTVDVTRRDEVFGFVAAALRTAPQVDILVNNAGGVLGQTGRPLEDVPLEDWQGIFDVNVTGAFTFCQAVAPGMKAARQGRIVNISSGAGLGISLTGIQAYAAAKAANPEVVVLAAPLAPTLEPDGSPWGLNDLVYLERLYEAGAAPYFDALAVHTYGFTFPPEAEPGPDILNFRRIELIREIMTAHGDAAKPIYVTESGWNDHPRWTKAVRPLQRIQYTIASYEWAEAHMPYVEKLCQWVLRYPAPTRSYPDNFTFLTADFRPRPIYEYVQAYAQGREIALP